MIGWSFRVCLGAEELEQCYADRQDLSAILPSHATCASRSPRFRLCSPEIRKKITPVLQATWHLALLPHSYHLVALPKNVTKRYDCGDNFSEKFRQPPRNIVIKHFDRRVVRRDESTEALMHTAQTLPKLITIPVLCISWEKKPVFDGRVRIDLCTYHSIDATSFPGSLILPLRWETLGTRLPLTKARWKCWKPMDWSRILFNSQSYRHRFLLLPVCYNSLVYLQKTL